MNQNGCLERKANEYLIPLGIHKRRKHGSFSETLLPIIPVFLPFAGCEHRCIFCAQDRQTGMLAERLPLTLTLAKSFEAIQTLQIKKKTDFSGVELAFYGGTFTAIPEDDRNACLTFAQACRHKHLVCQVRCSTRPDEVSVQQLTQLRDAGVDLVELGVQSFQDAALLASRRGYTGDQAREGCHSVVHAGLRLGIQLLPGMPGSTPESFLEDVQTALEMHPDCLRFYPCLVVDGTPLAEYWRKGQYVPWDIPTTVATLGKALAACWKQDVPVIRLSLAPEESLDAAVLAGPRHPALGSMIQGEALMQSLEPVIHSMGCPPDTIVLPVACRGFFSGHRGMLRPRWEALGVFRDQIIWDETTVAHLVWA